MERPALLRVAVGLGALIGMIVFLVSGPHGANVDSLISFDADCVKEYLGARSGGLAMVADCEVMKHGHDQNQVRGLGKIMSKALMSRFATGPKPLMGRDSAMRSTPPSMQKAKKPKKKGFDDVNVDMLGGGSVETDPSKALSGTTWDAHKKLLSSDSFVVENEDEVMDSGGVDFELPEFPDIEGEIEFDLWAYAEQKKTVEIGGFMMTYEPYFLGFPKDAPEWMKVSPASGRMPKRGEPPMQVEVHADFPTGQGRYETYLSLVLPEEQMFNKYWKVIINLKGTDEVQQ
jgi:hypothetical protein